MNTYAHISLILHRSSYSITNCVLLLPTLIVSSINAYTQLFINKTLLFALIHVKYLNYNLALVKVFNRYPVTLSNYYSQMYATPSGLFNCLL